MAYIVIGNKNRPDMLRRKVDRLRYRLTKSRWRYHTSDNWGGVQLINTYNTVVLGDRYGADLDHMEEFLNRASGDGP